MGAAFRSTNENRWSNRVRPFVRLLAFRHFPATKLYGKGGFYASKNMKIFLLFLAQA
jgi:hypothetical protein